MSVRFYKEGIKAQIPNRQKLIRLILFIGIVEEKQVDDINIILVTDRHLLKLNRQYLQHDYYTDIITFQHPTPPGSIAGDFYISFDRVADNAKQFNITFAMELSRVIIHGVLHLCGYHDKRRVDIMMMREKEEFYLESLKAM